MISAVLISDTEMVLHNNYFSSVVTVKLSYSLVEFNVPVSRVSDRMHVFKWSEFPMFIRYLPVGEDTETMCLQPKQFVY